MAQFICKGLYLSFATMLLMAVLAVRIEAQEDSSEDLSIAEELALKARGEFSFFEGDWVPKTKEKEFSDIGFGNLHVDVKLLKGELAYAKIRSASGSKYTAVKSMLKSEPNLSQHFTVEKSEDFSHEYEVGRNEYDRNTGRFIAFHTDKKITRVVTCESERIKLLVNPKLPGEMDVEITVGRVGKPFFPVCTNWDGKSTLYFENNDFPRCIYSSQGTTVKGRFHRQTAE